MPDVGTGRSRTAPLRPVMQDALAGYLGSGFAVQECGHAMVGLPTGVGSCTALHCLVCVYTRVMVLPSRATTTRYMPSDTCAVPSGRLVHVELPGGGRPARGPKCEVTQLQSCSYGVERGTAAVRAVRPCSPTGSSCPSSSHDGARLVACRPSRSRGEIGESSSGPPTASMESIMDFEHLIVVRATG